MKQTHASFTAQPYPRRRLLMVDGGRFGTKKHTIHGLVEFDITDAREAIRQHKRETGEAISFSAFFLACLGKAIEQDKSMHAIRDWRNRLITYDEVDANMLFEVEVDGEKTIRPHILRGVNHKSMRAIHEEIRAFQASQHQNEESDYIDLLVRFPAFIRRALLWILLKNARMVKEYSGTVLVSSIGMFGTGSGWGIPVPNHSLQVTLGGIQDKPGVVKGSIEVRKYMSVTISFDHDVIDGAPAARFIHRLKKLVEDWESIGGKTNLQQNDI